MSQLGQLKIKTGEKFEDISLLCEIYRVFQTKPATLNRA